MEHGEAESKGRANDNRADSGVAKQVLATLLMQLSTRVMKRMAVDCAMVLCGGGAGCGWWPWPTGGGGRVGRSGQDGRSAATRGQPSRTPTRATGARSRRRGLLLTGPQARDACSSRSGTVRPSNRHSPAS
eukprot:14317276-Alexandrium_andersonii.AAC.3